MPEGKHILVVEDDRFLSSLIKARLEKDGFFVGQAFDGEEGRQYLKKGHPDLIVLDLIMPKVPGFQLLEEISLDPNLSRIPVVILSNLAQESDVMKAKQLGAVEYFVKVRVSIDDLIKRIKDLLISGK
ncbi:MAG: response regulator [Candidatus Liptonbacteria bacterium]|nr:response regulator [Candidatus Liptonbacteria bacterium]